jgi:hypothetical protein
MTRKNAETISTTISRILMLSVFLGLMVFGVAVNPDLNWLSAIGISALSAFVIPIPVLLLVNRLLLVGRKRSQLQGLSPKWRTHYLSSRRVDFVASIRALGALVALTIAGLLLLVLLVTGVSSVIGGLASLGTGTLLAIVIVLLVLK